MASLLHTCRKKQSKLQVRFDQWSENLLDGFCYSSGTIKSHLEGTQTWPIQFSHAPQKEICRPESVSTADDGQCFFQLRKAAAKNRTVCKKHKCFLSKMPPGSCQQVFYLPSYFREGHSLKSPTVALTFSLGQVGPSSTSRLASCHESSDGRCEIAGDLLASGTPVLSFLAFDSL